MAVNESLTVFNLVDGVVEFHDESGTDESEGSNDLYNSTDDYYINSTQPDGQSLSFSSGFTMSSTTGLIHQLLVQICTKNCNIWFIYSSSGLIC